jgi:aminoglycoside 6'-N-acetyltransferase
MDDAARWHEIQSSPDVRAYTSWPERTAAESRTHLKHRTKHVVLRRADDFLALAIEHDGQLVGDVALHLRSVSPTTRFVEISWILHPEHYGHGFAREAAEELMNFAFERAAARWIVAVIHPHNAPSIALASSLGFTQVSTTDDSLCFIAGTPAQRRAVSRERPSGAPLRAAGGEQSHNPPRQKNALA